MSNKLSNNQRSFSFGKWIIVKQVHFLIMLFFLLVSGTAFSQITVAILGSNSNANIATYLNANGFTATDFASTIPAKSILDNYDAVILLRMNGNDDLKNWVNDGGLLITEWDATAWAVDVANLLNADVQTSSSVGAGTSITFATTTLGNKLGASLPNPYSDGGATEFFYTLTNIGSGVEILATRPTNLPVIIGGSYGLGYTFIIAYDWADGFPSGGSNNGILLKNTLNSGVVSFPPANPTSITATYSTICSGSSTQLTANGAVGTVYWYTGSCGGTSVTTGNPVIVSPATNTTYYARNYNNSQFSAGCASVAIIVTPRPTVADLKATGAGIKWYLSSSGGTALATTTLLVNNTHYWASQTINGVESTTRFEVVASITNP